MRMTLLEADPSPGMTLVSVHPTTPSSADVYLASLSSGSRRAMRQALGVVSGLAAGGAPLDQVAWHALRYEHVMAIRAKLAEGYAPSSANKILAALRGVLRAAFGLGLLGADELHRALAAKGVRGSRIARGRAITKRELEKLFEACTPNTTGGARDAALLAVLYGGGLRRSEAVGLDLADFDPKSETLKIRGKGNKERLMFATNGGRRALLAWIGVRADTPGPLFCPVTRAGVVIPRRLSSQAVLDLVARLAARAGLSHLSPHDFRRTFVGDLLDAGADLATVQALAGHASPTTTARYDRRGDRARRRAAELLQVPFVEHEPAEESPP